MDNLLKRPIGGKAPDSFRLFYLTTNKDMKKLFHFLKCWLITGDEAELEIVLEWYDLVLAGMLVLYLLYLIIR